MGESEENEETCDNIEQLLLTILVPSYPPNRSQWKKLENALKFIKKSRKASGSDCVTRKMCLLPARSVIESASYSLQENQCRLDDSTRKASLCSNSYLLNQPIP